MRVKQILVYAVLLLTVASVPFADRNSTGRRYYVSTIFSWWPTFRDPALFETFVKESKQKGMNAISLDIPWSIQRDSGQFDFVPFDSRIDYVVSQGMSVFITLNATTLGEQSPKWLTDEMLQCTSDGEVYRREIDGGTLPSLAHPVVRRKITRFAEALAQRYGSRYRSSPYGDYPIVAISPAFDLNLNSEYFPDAEVDYSPAAQADFSEWVRTEYASIKELNSLWGKSFTGWDQVNLKEAHPTARELYYEFTLQRSLDGVANAVREVSSLQVGMRSGCIMDNPNRHSLNVTPLLKNMDWLFVSTLPDHNHSFSADYARCLAPNRKTASIVESASHAEATSGRYFNQGVRAYEHGTNAVVVANWDIASISDNDKWPFLHFIGKLARHPLSNPSPDKAIYVSTWDLINGAATIEPYLTTYEAVSDGGKKPVDILSDYIITTDPSRLSKYSEVYLPANWTIPSAVRKALQSVEKNLKVNNPLVAGTLDEYGRATPPIREQ